MCSGAVAASILAYILPALLFFAGHADEVQVAWRNLKTASAADPSPPSILPASVPTVDDNSPTAGADECKSAESAPVVDGREPETEIAGGAREGPPAALPSSVRNRWITSRFLQKPARIARCLYKLAALVLLPSHMLVFGIFSFLFGIASVFT